MANKKAALSSLSRWQLEVEELPSMQELMAWDEDVLAVVSQRANMAVRLRC